MDDLAWQRLLGDVAEHFDDLTLKRGYQCYREHSVVSFLEPGNGTIQAIVENGGTYRVNIDFDFFATSLCDCPADGYCKHMAAVLMECAEQHGRSVHAVVNAYTTARFVHGPVKPTPAAKKKAPVRPAIAADPLQPVRLAAAGLATAGAEEWRTWFKLCAGTLPGINQYPGSAANRVLSVIRQCLPAFPAALERVFLVNARLFLLERLFVPEGSASGYYSAYYTQLAITEQINEIADTLDEPLPSAGRDAVVETRLAETLAHVRAVMLGDTPAGAAFGALYGALWRTWLHAPAAGGDVYEAELARLARARERHGARADTLNGTLARATMLFYAGRDNEAVAELRAAARFRDAGGEIALELMNDIVAAGEWSRLRTWLSGTEELFENGYSRREKYFQMWDALVAHCPDEAEGMWRSLTAMLPGTAEIYEERLHRYGRLDEWIDYHMCVGTDPLELRASELQRAETGAPDMLLSFYHQAVERYVLLRSRDGYKASVKILKRLAKLYKKLKREERWERFFGAFTERHSRLRALREELRKGKLLS